MRASRRLAAATILVALLGLPARALADETDNFTCRDRLTTDALPALDALVNARIQRVLEKVNRRGPVRCDTECLSRALQRDLGASDLHPLTFVPHARLERWIVATPDVERCRLRFRDSVYGARPYNQPWLWPFNGRIILLADSIRLSGRTVGLDKVNHFIREGLEHWRDARRPGSDIASVMARELGPPGRSWRWNEYGLKGWSLTGVLSWADLAASYSGYRFWSDLLVLDRSTALILRDPGSGRFVQRRPFTFGDYVNDAWDEGINHPTYHPDLEREVSATLARRGQSLRLSACQALAGLPDAEWYVNPACTAGAAAR